MNSFKHLNAILKGLSYTDYPAGGQSQEEFWGDKKVVSLPD